MINLDEMKGELNRISGNNKNNDYLKMFVKMPQGEGFVVIRLLEPRKGGPFYVAVRNHTINDKRVQCPKELVSGRWLGTCDICNLYSNLWKQSEDPNLTEKQVNALRDQARSIKPFESYFYNCIVRKTTNENGEIEIDVGPKLFRAGRELHSRILTAILGDPTRGKQPLGDVTDITGETGRDFSVVKSLKGNFPDYTESEFLQPSPLSKDKKKIAQWLEALHDLTTLRKPKSQEEIFKEVQIFKGLATSDDTSFNKEELQKIQTKVKPVESLKKTTIVEDRDINVIDEDILKDLELDLNLE